MIVGMASLIGKVAMKFAVNDAASLIASKAQDQALSSVLGELIQETTQKLEARPQVLGVSSDTWYAFRLADEANWRNANRFLSDDLNLQIPRMYSKQLNQSGAAPFVVSVGADSNGVSCNFRKAPRSAGFTAEECRNATIEAVRKSIKRYVRMAACGQRVEVE